MKKTVTAVIFALCLLALSIQLTMLVLKRRNRQFLSSEVGFNFTTVAVSYLSGLQCTMQ